MGFDMYLNRHVTKYRKPDGTLTSHFEAYSRDKFGRSNRVSEEVEAAYWRKANMIHRWFVTEVQDGEDDCRTYDVDIEQIRELLAKCREVVSKMVGHRLFVPEESLEEFRRGLEGRCENPDEVPTEILLTEANLTTNFLGDKSCLYALDDGAAEICEEILPTVSGCFFGSVTSYLWDVINTVAMLERVVAEHEELLASGEFPYYTYQASW